MLDIDNPKPLWVSFKILRDIIPKDSYNKICSLNSFDYDLQANRTLPNDDDVIAYNDFIDKMLEVELPILTDDFDPFNMNLSAIKFQDETLNVFQQMNEIQLENIE